MKDQHPEKDLIRKMLSGTLNAEEQHQITQLMESPDFQMLFNAVLDEQGGELDMTADDDTKVFIQEKLQAFQELTQQEANHSGAPVVKMFSWKRMLPYAAAAVVAAGSFIFWLSGANNKQHTVISGMQVKKNVQALPGLSTIQYTERYNPSKRRMEVKLPDGSTVTLGSQSRLKYPSDFARGTRDIYLEGVAFFEVTRHPEQPFTVYTGQVHTLVLGTSFKVSAPPKAPVEVSVVTGKVRVSDHSGSTQNDLATMLPGEKITWNNSKLARLKIDPRDILAWKNEQLVFRKETLKHILDVFQQHYGIRITVINKGFLTERLSLSLDEKMPLRKAMNVLAGTAGFEHSIDSLSGAVIIK